MGDVEKWTKNPAVNGLLTLLLVLCWYLHTEATGRIKELEKTIIANSQKIAVTDSEVKQLRRIADKLEMVPVELASIKSLLKARK